MMIYEEIIKTTGLTRQAIDYRINKLNIPAAYNSDRQRIFTSEEAEKLINYKADKPGRKREDGK